RLHTAFLLPQNRNDLLFREPQSLHRPYPFPGAGLYSNLEEVQGLRSLPIFNDVIDNVRKSATDVGSRLDAKLDAVNLHLS
ncbi:MAG TPA: hypothetical protein VGT78_09015, partial [Rhizomicrobium sp.]|nr:hypothetical protein [Rhizomicrobium sp.]